MKEASSRIVYFSVIVFLIVVVLGSVNSLAQTSDSSIIFNGNFDSDEFDGAIWRVIGKVGGAYEFDGKNFIKLDNLEIEEDFSIVSWIKPDLARNQIIASENGIEFSISENGFLIGIINGQSKSRVLGGEILRTGNWVHVALIYDYVSEGKSILEIYVNGESDGLITNAVKGNFNGDFLIGDGFDGMIDEFIVFNRVLLHKEIFAIFNNNEIQKIEGGEKNNCPEGYKFGSSGCEFLGSCEPYYVCSGEGPCTNGIRENKCEDLKCGGLTRIERIECELSACVPNYDCSIWSECIDGISKRDCKDSNNCNLENLYKPVENAVCGKIYNLELSPDEFCAPNILCDAWKSCEYVDEIDSILDGNVRLNGVSERNCKDLNGCVVDYKDLKPCKSEVSLDFVREGAKFSPNLEKIKCEDNFLSLYLNNIPVSYVDLESYNEGKFDVGFVQRENIYCSSCFNGILDEGEDSVDCGGICKDCNSVKKNRFKFVDFGIWIIFGLLVALLVYRNLEICRKVFKWSFLGNEGLK